jgi:hypothetical protein
MSPAKHSGLAKRAESGSRRGLRLKVPARNVQSTLVKAANRRRYMAAREQAPTLRQRAQLHTHHHDLNHHNVTEYLRYLSYE